MFLLEWLSFLHRYVPIGLLERPPQRMNQRPEPYQGRDDLETLMASPRAADWIRISYACRLRRLDPGQRARRGGGPRP